MIKTKLLLASIVICFTPAILGGIATSSAVTTWYPLLNKPEFTPPNWLFGPAWTLLYFLQSISLYLIQVTKTKDQTAKAIAVGFFFTQLILNLLWSVIFFGLRNPALALIEIGLLDITVVFTIIASYRVHKTAGLILLPYLAWILFATWLNFQIFILNR
jgi:translocator protein